MLTIITNNHRRPVVDASELTEAEREDFDYLDWAAIERGEDSASFVRYRGDVISLADFSATYGISGGTGLPAVFAGWDGLLSDSFFSGNVIRFDREDSDYVIVGRYIN